MTSISIIALRLTCVSGGSRRYEDEEEGCGRSSSRSRSRYEDEDREPGDQGRVKSNDYPTEARADYVFGCMKANRDTRTSLEHCSCSIDVIAKILPYDRYVEAEAVLSLSQAPGRFGAMFRSPEPAKAAVKGLRRAQAEADCF